MKIVIVEDNIDTRNDIVSMVTRLSPEYEVAGLASDGDEGLKVIHKVHPDLVLTAIGLPKTDGLTMLADLRRHKENFRAIILTSHTEFDYLQRAVCLGIENYLLKPVNPDELSDALETINEQIVEQNQQDKLRHSFFTMEQLIRSLILAELPVNDDLKILLKDEYGLMADEPLVLFGIWLGSHFEEDRERVLQVVESYAGKVSDYMHVTIPSYHYRAVLMVLYDIEDVEKLYERFRKTVSLVLTRNFENLPVLTWMVCDGIDELAEGFEKSISARKWNLDHSECTLIKVNDADLSNTVHISFPLQREEEIRAVVAERNLKRYHRMIKDLEEECKNGSHNPDEIREICVGFCLAILDESQIIGRIYPVVSRQEVVSRIDHAFTWEEIEDVFEEVYQSVVVDEEMDKHLSPLIHRALSLIEEGYTKGITLEDIARKLAVSQEYLSYEFKKETGHNFKETVRRYQITKVKELLLQTEYKLGKIADLSGYSDPKYMSKVFKDEVGMLPSEFRSMHR